jgi:hypothetical protein
MLGSVKESEFDRFMKQPDEIGGAETQSAYVIVSDADALYARAKAAGAACNRSALSECGFSLIRGTPVPLRGVLSSHTVTTVYEKGWSRIRNGDLLRLADQESFEVFLTTDQNLKHQQNLTDLRVAIIVLPTTSWPVIQKHAAKIVAVLDSTSPGDFIQVSFE